MSGSPTSSAKNNNVAKAPEFSMAGAAPQILRRRDRARAWMHHARSSTARALHARRSRNSAREGYLSGDAQPAFVREEALLMLTPDLIVYLCEFLSGKDLVSLSEISKSCAWLLEDQWERSFKTDFGPSALEAREMLLLATPDLSWRKAYLHCTYRKVYLWGDLQAMSKSTYQARIWARVSPETYSGKPCLGKPLPLNLPANITPKDVGCSEESVYILNTYGELKLFHPKIVHKKWVWIDVGDDIPTTPGPLSAMAVLRLGYVVGIDMSGNWWVFNNMNWLLVQKSMPIWPGTLGKTFHGEAAALSRCGRYIYGANTGDMFKLEVKVISIPELVDDLPLKSIDNFFVNIGHRFEGSSAFVTCLQVDGMCYVSYSDRTENRTTTIKIETGGLFVSGNWFRWRHELVRDAIDTSHNGIGLELVNAWGGDSQVFHVDPDTGNMTRFHYKGQDLETEIKVRTLTFSDKRFYIDRTSAGELYSGGSIRGDFAYLAGCDLRGDTMDFRNRLSLAPVTRLCVSRTNAVAL